MGMLAKRKKRRDTGGIPTASTSDVAFLLLIFFIVMPMKTDEIGISLVLPGKSQNTNKVNVAMKNVAVIKVLPSDGVLFDGAPIRLPRHPERGPRAAPLQPQDGGDPRDPSPRPLRHDGGLSRRSEALRSQEILPEDDGAVRHEVRAYNR